jgi:peroxin-5
MFTRAIYNLGVSCLNIHCYHEAAEHLLAGLALHKRASSSTPLQDSGGEAEDDGSANLWHTLRRAFICLVRFSTGSSSERERDTDAQRGPPQERTDLAARCKVGADVDSFRRDGFDF